MAPIWPYTHAITLERVSTWFLTSGFTFASRLERMYLDHGMNQSGEMHPHALAGVFPALDALAALAESQFGPANAEIGRAHV